MKCHYYIPENFTELPIKTIILYSFILNAIWEFVQCIFLYNMWSWSFIKSIIVMWLAILGDVLITLSIIYIVAFLIDIDKIKNLNLKAIVLIVLISFYSSVFLELTAKVLKLWEYSEYMPVITIMDYTLGLSPIVQISLLPLLSVYLSKKLKKTAGLL